MNLENKIDSNVVNDSQLSGQISPGISPADKEVVFTVIEDRDDFVSSKLDRKHSNFSIT